MGEVGQLNNIVKNNESPKSLVDQNEILHLKKVLDSNKDNQLDDNVKETLQKKESIKPLVNGIKNFLDQPARLENMSSQYLLSYKNILVFLNDSIDNSLTGDKKDQFSSAEKIELKGLISTLVKSLDKQIFIILEKEKKVQDAANEAKLEKEGPEKFLKMIKNGLTSGSDAYGTLAINNLFENNPDLVSKTLNMFIENYNSNSPNKLTKKNLTEQMYNISPEQKDLFSGYIAEVIVANTKFINSASQTMGAGKIPNFRKNIYPLLFKDDQEIPLLLSQKRMIVGDKSSTLGIVPGYQDNQKYDSFGVNLFNYNKEHPGNTSTNISWLPGQQTMDISFLASGVDGRGASIDVKIGDVLIRGVTHGFNKNAKNQIDRNLIKWNIVSGEPPKGLSIQDGSIKIDAKIYGSKPIVIANITSINNDEVMIRAATNGQFDIIAGKAETSGKGSFELGKRELSEEGKNTFAEQVEGVKENINMRLPRGTKLIVNMGSGVDKTPVSTELEKTLQKEVSDLKDYFSGKGYAELIKDMESKSDNGGFVDQGNKLLAQARFLTGLKYMIENLKQDPNVKNTYLDKLEFKVTEIKQTKDKRYFDFEMSKYAVKATAKTSA